MLRERINDRIRLIEERIYEFSSLPVERLIYKGQINKLTYWSNEYNKLILLIENILVERKNNNLFLGNPVLDPIDLFTLDLMNKTHIYLVNYSFEKQEGITVIKGPINKSLIKSLGEEEHPNLIIQNCLSNSLNKIAYSGKINDVLKIYVS